MTNPSTIWASLSLPQSPVGSIPFVDIDLVTIITDVSNFFYTAANATLPGGTSSQYYNQLTVLNGLRQGFTDVSAATATPATINKAAGRIKMAAGTSSFVVNSTLCFANSLIFLQKETADATATRFDITSKAAGTFTITANANATGAIILQFLIVNVY
jgi:hypothetical protein